MISFRIVFMNFFLLRRLGNEGIKGIDEIKGKQESSISLNPSISSSSSRPGYVFLIAVLLVGAMTTTATVSLLLLSWANEQNGVTFVESVQALLLARSCADKGLQHLQASPTYNGSGVTTIGRGTCQVVSTQGAGAFDRSLCSEGRFGNATRRIRVDIEELFPEVSIRNYEEVENFAGCGGRANWTENFSGSTVSSAASSTSSSGGGRTVVCHRGSTITVNQQSLQAHVNHGDALGECGESSSSSSSPNTDTLLVFDISNSGSIVFFGSSNVGGVNAIVASGTAALLGGIVSGSEFRVVSMNDPSGPTLVGSYAGPAAGLSTAQGRGQAILGAERTGVANGRIRLWRSEDEGVLSSPGPWTYTTSGSALRMAVDPNGCFLFTATNWATEALQIVDIENEAMTEVETYAVNASSRGLPTSLQHDPAKNRVYLLTSKAFLALGPSSLTPSCP